MFGFGGKADAVVEMQARWNGEPLKRGLQQSKTQVESFQKSVKSASAFMSGPLGFLGVAISVGTLADKIKGLAEEDRQMRRLTSSIERFAGTAPDLAKVNQQINYLRNNSIFGDTEITVAFQKLVETTQDYAGALYELPVVIDVASAKNKSLEESAKLVGFAMKGIVEPLGELSPAFRKLARETASQQGTAETAAKAMKMLRDEVGGAAKDEVDSLAGAMSRLGDSFNEVTDSFLRFTTGSGTVQIINDLADALYRATDGLEKLTTAQRAVAFLGGPLATIWYASRAGSDAKPASQSIDEFYQPYYRQFATTGPNPWGTSEQMDKDRARWAKERADAAQNAMYGRSSLVGEAAPWQSFRDVVRGAITGPRDGTDRAGQWERRAREFVEREYKDAADFREKLRNDALEKEKARIRELGAELQGTLTGAFYSAFDGVDALGDYIKQKLIGEALSNVAAAITNMFIPGGSYSPLFRWLSGVKNPTIGGEGQVIGGSSSSYGLRGAQQAQAVYRGVRRG